MTGVTGVETGAEKNSPAGLELDILNGHGDFEVKFVYPEVADFFEARPVFSGHVTISRQSLTLCVKEYRRDNRFAALCTTLLHSRGETAKINNSARQENQTRKNKKRGNLVHGKYV
jgi:hypothetical protein